MHHGVPPCICCIRCSCDQTCRVTASVLPEGPAELRTFRQDLLNAITQARGHLMYEVHIAPCWCGVQTQGEEALSSTLCVAITTLSAMHKDKPSEHTFLTKGIMYLSNISVTEY